MRARKIIGQLLLAFVLVSVGFAIGQEVQRHRLAAQSQPAGPNVAAGRDKVIVYYLHPSFRCLTCNMVESMGEQLVRTEFAQAVAADRLEWKAVDYQRNDQLARHYDVAGSMIVVARFRGGQEVAARRLDRVMELANNRQEFLTYVRGAIRELLEDKP